ncbi:NLP9-like [Olea europaea subsp. europaea]|uniref:NLP9-like n=1 Tax=Olea europaea subsp. europaea TaxID=158383 RepID=A0A8S0T3B6_OLEEU|nr:NLP9-like [Olea europaea subsp. europaea]
MAAADEFYNKWKGDDAVTEHIQPTSPGLTDSSNGSRSTMNVMKAAYMEDTVRFKFESTAGCLQLYEEVAKRFKLQIGEFQLKYLDDEVEWVMLVKDLDLQVCLEILDFVGGRTVKFLVRDVPCVIGSSGSSNCYLTGSS